MTDAGSLADRLEGIVVSRAAADYKLQRREASTLREAASVLRALAGTRETAQACEHEWVDASNEAVESGEICLKCNAIQAAQAAPSEPANGGSAETGATLERDDGAGAPSVVAPGTDSSPGSLGAAALPPRGDTSSTRICDDGWACLAPDCPCEDKPPRRAALPPNVYADARAVREALEWIGGHDTHWRKGGAGGRCDKCAADSELRAEGLAALARLVAALPDAPAEAERARPQWWPNNETGGAQTTPFPSSRAGDVPAGDAGQ